jgi:chromosome segregation ATPase
VAPISSTERDLGRLLAAVENLTAVNKEDREDGRERSKKLDNISDKLQIVDEKLREQSRLALEQEIRVNASIRDAKDTAENNSKMLNSRINSVSLDIEEVKKRIAETTTKMTDLASEQTKIRAEVGDVKSDTLKLQVPVNQLVSIRRAMIAWGGGIIVVTGYIFWLFRPAWDAAIQHFTASVFR